MSDHSVRRNTDGSASMNAAAVKDRSMNGLSGGNPSAMTSALPASMERVDNRTSDGMLINVNSAAVSASGPGYGTMIK